VRKRGVRDAERTKGVQKNEDGDNESLRLTGGRQSTIAALESEKDRARRFKQRVSTCILLYCLYHFDSLASWIVQ
jgi:hypothetical protein